MKTILIEDEANSRTYIRSLIKDTAPFLDLVAEAGHVDEAVHLIREHQPELVMTDIMLYGRSAFDIFKSLGHHSFRLIFITAFKDFAIPALRLSAVDYLLKPVSPLDFAVTMERLKRSAARDGREMLPQKRRLFIHDQKEIHIVSLDDILYVEGDGSYSLVKLATGKQIVCSKRLSELEEMIASNDFFRVHKSYLVHLPHVVRYVKGRGGEVVMSDGSVVYVSSRRKDQFLSVLAG